MTLQDEVVAAVLRSRLHRLLSGSTDLVRFTGRRTGRVVQTPTQYARATARTLSSSSGIRTHDAVLVRRRPR